MTGDELQAWRVMVGLSQDAAAAVLGYGRRQYQRMEYGIDVIRACVDLACAAYAMGVRSYKGPEIKAHLNGKKKRKAR